mgnify:FL=1
MAAPLAAPRPPAPPPAPATVPDDTPPIDRALWRIDGDAEQRLADMAHPLDPAIDKALADFYRFVTQNPSTAPLFPDLSRVEQARHAHHALWRDFFTGGFGGGYAQRIRTVGRVHQRVGLTPAQYMAGYAFMLEALVRDVILSRRKPQAAEDAALLIRTVLMEAEAALSSYIRINTASDSEAEMREFADSFERELGGAVDLVRRNATVMEAAADEVLAASNTVSSLGAQVTAASQDTTVLADSVADSARSLSESVDGIARRVEHAAQSSRGASQRSAQAQESAIALTTASERIGSVVTLIERIAKETRLLALNASIEAARAGDAGRGFAVVANEVKTLADQTNNATSDIRTQIETMQGFIRDTAAIIHEVGTQVDAVASDIGNVTLSVSEQAEVTRTIAGHADTMADTMRRMHGSIEEVAASAGHATAKAGELWENASVIVKQIYGIRRRVTASLRGTHLGNRRREERVAVDLTCTGDTGGTPFRGRLDNISTGGCQVRDMTPTPSEGQPIRLDIQNLGPATGAVVGVDGDMVHVRFDPLPPPFLTRLQPLMAEALARDAELTAIARDTAAAVGALFEKAVDRGEIGMDRLFSADYAAVPGSNPPQYTTPFTDLCDRVLPGLQEPVVGRNPRIVFCVAVDRNGYLPTHNRAYSQPQRPDDPVWNTANSRHRRLFDDSTGLAAARSRQPALIQTYRRDMGGGRIASMKDISAPVYVKGKHWGAVRLGCTA